MRGGAPDPFEPDGSEGSDPGAWALVAWSGLAALALVFAAAAVIYGAPEGSPRETLAVDLTATGSLPGGAGGEIGLVSRGDFSMTTDGGEAAEELSQLKIENAALRQADAGLRTRIDELTDRIATLEDRIGDLTGTLRQTAPEAVSPGPAGPAAFAVELGAFADLAAARQAWTRLVGRAPALFSDLAPLVTVRDRGGRTELLLVAGPIAEAAEAAERCSRAGDAEIDCLPAYYVGQPLAPR